MAAVTLLLLSGCGSGQRTLCVWGEVSFDGNAVGQGEIVFRPVEGTSGPATGGTIEKGRYEVPAVVGLTAGGTYRVEIIGLAPSGRTIANPLGPAGEPIEALENHIPPEYNTQSILKVTVSPDVAKNRHDFRLKAGPNSSPP